MSERHPLTGRQTRLRNQERVMDISDWDPSAWEALNERELVAEQGDADEVERLRAENDRLRHRAEAAEACAEIAERALKEKEERP